MNATQAIATTAGTAPRAAKLLVAALLAIAAIMVTTDRVDAAQVGFLDANSDIGFADSDGYVPIYNTCLPNDVGAEYIPYYDGVAIHGSIIVNLCALERFGAGPRDYQRLIEHEMGHSRGLLHSSNPNDIMYAAVPVTGT